MTPLAVKAPSRSIAIVFGIAIAVLSVAAVLAQDARIPIFIGPAVRDGFVDVDQGILDSIRDIQNEFRKSKRFVVLSTPERVTLTLTVVGRRSPGESGSIGVPIGTLSVFVPIQRRAIDTVLRRGEYERKFTSESDDDAWREAAEQVVRDVSAWANANRERLP